MDLTAFLAENVEIRENKKIVVSNRFKGKDGKPVEWEIRSITAEEDAEIRKKCVYKTPTGKNGRMVQEFDAWGYSLRTTARAVVFPNLSDDKLLKSYGVQSADKLLTTMLYKDELDKLSEAVMGLSEVEDVNDLVDEAKN